MTMMSNSLSMMHCRIILFVKTDEANTKIKMIYLEVASTLHVFIIKYGFLLEFEQ